MNYSLVFISALLTSFGPIFLKSGMQQKAFIKKIKFILLGFAFHFFAAIAFILALRKIELSIAFPLAAVQYPLILFFSKIFLGEKINKFKLIGVSLIFFGIFFISLT